MIAFLLSCAPDYTASDAKLVGVGYDPEEIGPSPQPYGGVVEYSWVNFAGAGLNLAMMQLASYAEIGPDFGGFAPPYAAVYGFSYLFSDRLTAADSLGGVTAVPPDVEDTCYTTFEATGPIGSFTTVDVGSWMRFTDADGGAVFTLDRLPSEYPSNPQDSFVYYSSFDFWNPEPVTALVAGDSGRIDKMESVVLRPDNFPFGTELEFSFPGGFAPDRSPLASLPQASRSAGTTKLQLPDAPGGVQLEWTGARYDGWGREVGSGENTTCLSFAAPDGVPQNADECAAPVTSSNTGQIYTGPWDTEDGRVLFRWQPGTNPDQAVTLSVRFLGPVDRADPAFAEEVVLVEADEDTEAKWRRETRGSDQMGGTAAVPDEFPMPSGRRPPTACEEGATWTFDDDFLDGNGELIPSMRGDPNHNMAEVTCRLADDGEFVLNDRIVEEALTYARAHGAQGAVFYFGRSVEVDGAVPPAMDTYGQRLDITPIKVASRAIDIGRFWLEGE